MKKKVVIIIILLICLISLIFSEDLGIENQDQKLWKTVEDFKNAEPKIIKAINLLLENPLSEEIKDLNDFVMMWAVDVPYITLTINTDYVSGLYKEKDNDYKYMGVLTVSYLFGNLLYILENPSNESTEFEAIKKSLITLIQVYDKINQQKQDGYFEFMDNLKTIYVNNELDNYIISIQKHSKNK